MNYFNIPSKINFLLLAPVFFFLLASCGSYQYSGYEDGIYGEANRTTERQNQNATQNGERNDNSSYYKNLFAEEAALYGEVLSESTIFTDVDSYTSTGGEYQADQQSNYEGGRAPWGHNPDSYTVNIYNNGFYGGFFNPYWGGGLAFDPFFGPGYWGPGFYGPGYWGPGIWGNNWGIGFGGFAPYGFHYGFGGYAGFGPGYLGRGFYSPYNNFGYNYGYANNYRQNVSYNAGRRDATSNYGTRRNTSATRSAAILDSRGRTSSYSRSIRNLRNSNDDYGVTRRTVGREYESRRSTDYNTDVRSRSSSRIINSRNPGNYSRSQSPVSRNSGTVRSSSNTSRSSGTVRSSSSSSGRSSSGTSSSRGRGN